MRKAHRTMTPYYGLVYVHKGKHAGKLGFFDDDGTLNKGVVYFEPPDFSNIKKRQDYELVNYKYMTNIKNDTNWY